MKNQTWPEKGKFEAILKKNMQTFSFEMYPVNAKKKKKKKSTLRNEALCSSLSLQHAHTLPSADENSSSSLIFPFPSPYAPKKTPQRGGWYNNEVTVPRLPPRKNGTALIPDRSLRAALKGFIFTEDQLKELDLTL